MIRNHVQNNTDCTSAKSIGATPQPNSWSHSWVEFFREKRLRHMLILSRDAQLISIGERLLAKLDSFFEGINIKPSILHGDLWRYDLV